MKYLSLKVSLSLVLGVLFFSLVMSSAGGVSFRQIGITDAEMDQIFSFTSSRIEDIRDHIYHLSCLGSRVTGYDGFYQATRYIRQKFVECNLTGVNYQNWTATIPIDYGASISVLSPETYVINAYTVWPNSIQTSSVLPPGITGRLVYVGFGEYDEMNGNPINGSIVLMEFNSNDNWLNAAMLGAKAVIFIEPETTLTDQAFRKTAWTVPLYFPRLYMSRVDAQLLLSLLQKGPVTVNIMSNMQMEDREVSNIYGFVEGTDPQLKNEIIVISSYYDSFSYVPAVAPGAQESCGISALLEIARYFSLHPIKRTLMFVAFAGHGQTLLGAKEFVEAFARDPDLYNSIGHRIIMDIHLDLNSESTFVTTWQISQQYIGVYFPATVINRVDAFGAFVFRYKVYPTLESYTKRPVSETYSLQRNWAEHDWNRMLLAWVNLESDVFLMGGSGGYGIFSSNARRQYYQTPLDTFERVQPDNLKAPMQFILTTIALLDAEPDLSVYGGPLSSERIIGTTSARYGLSLTTGQIVEYNYTQGWYTPVPRAIIHVTRTFPGDPLGSTMPYPVSFFVRADNNGFFRIVGETPFSMREANAPGGANALPGPYIHAYVVNSTGNILYADDFGKYGAQRYPPIGLMDRPEVFLRIVVFKCSSIVLYNCLEPEKTKPAVGFRFVINDVRSHSEPESYGAAEDIFHYNGHLAIAFVPPKVPVEIIAYFSYEEQPLATMVNADSQHPTGVGYSLSEGGILELTPYDYAKDTYWLAQSYSTKAETQFLFGGFVQTLERASNYLIEAKDAYYNESYSVFWDRSVNAWLLAWRSYKDVKNTLRDAGRAVVFFCAILLPAAILAERIAQPSSANKRLLFILAYMATAFIILYFIHPGFAVIPNPFMTTLGIIIVALSIPLVYVIAVKMISALRSYRTKTTGRHEEEESRSQTMWTSLNIGAGYIRKRPMRMALSLVSIVTITAAMVSLMSLSAQTVVQPTTVVTGQTNYNGIQIFSDLGTDPIQPRIIEALQIEYGHEAIVAPRTYAWSTTTSVLAGGGIVGFKLYWNLWYGENFDNKTVLAASGVSPQEVNVTSLGKFLLPGGRWFIDTDYDACIISNLTAQTLGISNLPAKITWEGMEFTVIGIFDSQQINRVLDLDQRSLMPPDIWSNPYQGVSVTRVDSANTMLIPYKKAVSLSFQVYSVGIAFNNISKEEQDEKTQEIFLRFKRLTYSGRDGQIALYSERSLTTVLGWQYQIVPTFIGGLTIMNLILASIQERSKEIATLSSVGLSPLQISIMFLAEVLVYAVVGTSIGYTTGVAVGHYSSITSAHPEIYVNYGSTSSLLVLPITVGLMLASVIFPAIQASRMVTPSMERKWKVSAKSKGDEWEIVIPFTVSSIQKVSGLIAFLEEFYRGHLLPQAEDFKVDNMKKELTGNAGILRAVVRLLPYEQGIIQEATITGSRPLGTDRYIFRINVKRTQGDRSIWETSNRIFFDAVRKQFLYWHSLKEEEQAKYMT